MLLFQQHSGVRQFEGWHPPLQGRDRLTLPLLWLRFRVSLSGLLNQIFDDPFPSPFSKGLTVFSPTV